MIKTDHEALKHFMEQKLTTILQEKWLLKMLDFDYSIVYKKGRKTWLLMHSPGCMIERESWKGEWWIGVARKMS